MSTHYGGVINSRGRLSAKPDGQNYFKVVLFAERLVRFDIAKVNGTSLLSDKDIGKVLGRSVRALENYRKNPLYLRKRMELMTGIGLEIEQDVEKIASLHKQQLRLMLPTAMRTIYDAIQRPDTPNTTLAERKFKVDVARDILDREGTFPKISRTDSHLKVDHNFSDMDGVSKELLDSVDVPSDESKTTSIMDKIALSTAFSNTETLTPQDMEKSLKDLETMKTTTGIQ